MDIKKIKNFIISWLKNGSRLKAGWCEKYFSARIGCSKILMAMLRFQKVFLSHLEAENKHMVIINRINRNVWGTMWQSFIVTWSSIAQYPYVKIFGAIWLWNYHCLRYKTVSHFCEITLDFFFALKSSLRSIGTRKIAHQTVLWHYCWTKLKF